MTRQHSIEMEVGDLWSATVAEPGCDAAGVREAARANPATAAKARRQGACAGVDARLSRQPTTSSPIGESAGREAAGPTPASRQPLPRRVPGRDTRRSR